MNLAKKGTIISIREIARRTVGVAIKVPEDFAFRAGQYICLMVPELKYSDIKGNARMFSIVSSPNLKGQLDIIFRTSESGYKKTLVEMTPGAEIAFSGPFGPLGLPEDSSLPVVFVAGGVGVAPFLSMIRFAGETHSGHKITLIYANTSEQEAAYLDELSRIEKENPNFKLVKLSGLLGKEILREPASRKISWFVVGPSGFVDYVAGSLIKYNVPLENMIFEQFYPSVMLTSSFAEGFKPNSPGSAWIDNPYFLAMNNVPTHITVTDVNGVILYANEGARKITGYALEEMQGNTPRLWGALMPADFYKDLWRTVKYDRQQFYAEVKNRRKNQEEYDAAIRINPVIGKDGDVEGFIGIEEDITAHNQVKKDLAETVLASRNVLEDLQVEKEKIAEAKAKDEALLASIGEGLIAIDNDRKVLVMNKAAEDMLDLRARDIIGTVINYLFLTDAAGNILPLEKRPTYIAIKTGKSVTTPTGSDAYFFVRQDETKFPIAITVTPVMLEGKIAGAVVIFRDLTKEKEIEKLRMDFLSLASHQLRTPLSGTKWLIETIKRGVIGKMNEKQNEYLGQIYQINERMIQLVSDMLSVLRFESTATVVQKEIIHVSELFQYLRIFMEAAAKSQNITLRYPPDHRMLTIETDPAILKSILECFLSNAVNYSSPGQEVTTDVKEEATAIIFLVKDNGIGIPKEEQKRIFERFYRASNAKTFKPEGTGLGLYIASTLAEKIGAIVSFESEEDKGSTFYLRIPRTKVD